MNNSGFESVRDAIAQSLNRRFHTNFSQNNIIMTVGAAGGLNVIFKTLLDPQDEVIVFAPFFGEYRNYVSNYQGKLIVIPADTASFQPNLAMLQEMITAQTKAVIVNSPNNPTESFIRLQPSINWQIFFATNKKNSPLIFILLPMNLIGNWLMTT
jgi:aspartate aminotransferase